MLDGTGAAEDALTAARAALADTDARLAEADRALADALHGAHRVAAESVRRLEELGAEIEAAVTARRTDSATAAQEFGRFLLAKNREITTVVAGARSEAQAKAIALQELIAQYSPPPRSPQG